MSIHIKGLTKKYVQSDGTPLDVLERVSLEVDNGEFVALFGPNGCGKSTLLNIVAGIIPPDNGRVTIDNKSPVESKVGFIFQNYYDSLLPWRTVFGNVEFALEAQGINTRQEREFVLDILKKHHLFEHKDKYLYQLSGGLKQSVAITRALAYRPDILLLDEPFSALDYQTTRRIWLEVLNTWEEEKLTTLFVSHDADEAVFLADRVVVLSKRPASVVGSVKVGLPRPRTLEMLMSENFFSLRNEVLRLFDQGLS